jgi:hypothetical protein
MKKLELFGIVILLLPIIYLQIALSVFLYRNPTANQMSLFRDFVEVVTWETLDKYQP